MLLTKVMAAELALFGVRANCIAPGPVDTNLTKQVQTTKRAKHTTMLFRWSAMAQWKSWPGRILPHRA